MLLRNECRLALRLPVGKAKQEAFLIDTSTLGVGYVVRQPLKPY